MKKFFFVFLIITGLPASSSAILLGSFSTEVNAFYWSQQPINADMAIGAIPLIIGAGYIIKSDLNNPSTWKVMENPPGETKWVPGPPAVKLFDILGLSTESVGTKLASNVPSEQFYYITDFLTVKNQDCSTYWGYAEGHNDGYIYPEWQFNENYHGNGYNFFGYHISDISLTFDDLSLFSYTDGIFNHLNWNWNLTVEVSGVPVPESGTIILLSFGLIGFAFKQGKV